MGDCGACGACGAWKKTDANVNPTNAKTMVLFFSYNI